MKTNLKRIGAWALCFMLLLSCIPVSADDGVDYSVGFSPYDVMPLDDSGVATTSRITLNDGTWRIPVYYYVDGTENVTKASSVSISNGNSATFSGTNPLDISTELNGTFVSARFAKSASDVTEGTEITGAINALSTGYYNKTYYLSTKNYIYNNNYIFSSSDTSYNSYAVYIAYKPNTVTATFDLNGGTATDITPITKDPGTEITLPTTAPTKDGYTFRGWLSSADKTLYSAGGTVTLNANTTFTAQWAQNSTITFNYGGVTDVNGNTQIQYQDLKYGETYSFPDLENISWNGDDLDNRVMDCWTDPDGNLYSVYDKYEYTVTGNITYTLVWVYADNYCNIEFSIGDHGVFEGSDPETPAEPIEVQIPLNQRINAYLDMPGENIAVVPNTGYGFKGWVDSNNGQLLTDQTTVVGDMSFVAQYYKLITATFDLGEDVAFTTDYPTDENNSLVIGPDDDQLIFYLPTREQVSVSGAKVLDKWVDNLGQEYQPGEQVSLAESRTFMAVTTDDCYTIHFDANGDTIGTAPENIYVAKGDTFEFPAQGTMDHSNSKYVFGGWATSNNATAAQYLPGDVAPVPEGNTTYYAVWLSGYTITFYQNIDNNHNDSFTIKVPAGSTLTFPELPNDWNVDGYTFSGWSINKSGTTSDGEGAVFRPGIQWTYKPTSGTITTPTINRNYTFYGRWIQESAEDSNLAYFHIKMDGKIPFEPTGYTETSAYSKNDGMRGTVRTSTPVANDTDAVAKNIQSAPNLETIYDTLVRHSEFSTYFPEVANQGVNAKAYFVANYKVVWYVIKYVRCNGDHWHVDGIVIPKESYLVKYDPNGGTDAPLQHSQFKDDDVTVQFSPEPTRVGYTFLGWSEDPNATTPTYTSTGDKNFTMPEHDVTLYAVWKPNTSTAYKVQYYYSDGNGNYSSYDSEVTRYGTTGSVARVTTEDKKSTKLGYVLDTSKQNEYSGVILADGTLALKVYFKYTGFPFRTVNVEKVWRNPDSSAVFPSVIISLMRDGTVIATCTLSAENNWSGSFTDLPQYSPQSTLYQYTVTENAVDGYTTSITPTSVNASTYTVTNTLTNKDVVVTKNWVDSSNAYGTRPAAITLKLKNGSTVAETKTVMPEATAVSQTVTFTVPAYNSDGTVATYTVEEDAVNGYTTSVDGLTVTNTLKTYSLIVEKKIAGNMAYDQQDFTFTAKLLKPKSSTGDNGQPVQAYVDSGLYVTKDGLTNATSSFTLKANQSIELTGIPYGYKVEVTETGTPGYKAKTEQGGVTSDETVAGQDCTAEVGPFTYTGSNNAKITFINTNTATIDTGVTLDFLPYVLLILGVGVVVALWLVMSAKKRKDD